MLGGFFVRDEEARAYWDNEIVAVDGVGLGCHGEYIVV